MLAVKSTVYPDGFRILWVSGMPKHPELMMDSQLYNRWALYVHNLVLISKALTRLDLEAYAIQMVRIQR
jgi:hypothetical protein